MIPSSPPTALYPTGHENDGRWGGSLDDLERKMAAYRKLTSQGASQAQIDEAAEQVAAAIHSLSGNTPPTYDQPTVQLTAAQVNSAPQKLRKAKLTDDHWRVKTPFCDDKSDSGEFEKASPMKRAGRGMVMMVAAPIAAAGMGLYACGMVLEGGAELLKGLGSLGKVAMVSARGKRRRSPDNI